MRYLVLLCFCPVVFGHAQSPSFGPCNSDSIYVVNDYLYKDSFFHGYAVVDSPPGYPGGKDSIQAHFSHAVRLEGDEANLFAKYQVVFLVNCEGILSQIELKSNPIAGHRKVLDACATMRKWVPAERGGIPVNCLFRLGFTNRSGILTVDYRGR